MYILQQASNGLQIHALRRKSCLLLVKVQAKKDQLAVQERWNENLESVIKVLYNLAKHDQSKEIGNIQYKEKIGAC